MTSLEWSYLNLHKDQKMPSVGRKRKGPQLVLVCQLFHFTYIIFQHQHRKFFISFLLKTEQRNPKFIANFFYCQQNFWHNTSLTRNYLLNFPNLCEYFIIIILKVQISKYQTKYKKQSYNSILSSNLFMNVCHL